MNISSGYRKNGFDAYGGRYLQKSDMGFWMNLPKRTDPKGVCLELGADIEEVEPDFFELLPTINGLWILNPACNLHMTEKTAKLFRKNNVILRGTFDSAAERLAKEIGLRFLHLDLEIASAGDYYERGRDTVTLRFFSDGSAIIHQDCVCQGISAGNNGGGEVSMDLPHDFYKTATPLSIAEACWGSCYDEILRSEKLAGFLETAKAKNGFLIDYSLQESIADSR